jgi:hypothetical protein
MRTYEGRETNGAGYVIEQHTLVKTNGSVASKDNKDDGYYKTESFFPPWGLIKGPPPLGLTFYKRK